MPHSVSAAEDIAIEDAFLLATQRVYQLDYAGGFAGFAIQPTPFLTMSVVLSKAGERPLFDSFLSNSNVVVRAMGLACLAQTDTAALEKACERLKSDTAILTVWTGCCLAPQMTLGELAEKLRSNRNFLGYLDDYNEFRRFRQKVKIGKVDWEKVRYWPAKGTAAK